MIQIHSTSTNFPDNLKTVQSSLGGTIEEKHGEYLLTVNNALTNGTIRFLQFDRGISLIEYDLTSKEDLLFINHSKKYNPVRFSYCLSGEGSHKFEGQTEYNEIEPFQSVITCNKKDSSEHLFVKKNERFKMTSIHVLRSKFRKKRMQTLTQLHPDLFHVFLDKKQENTFAHFGTIHLGISEHVKSMRNIVSEGMTRVLQMEAKSYIILSLHIQQFAIEKAEKVACTPLTERELKTVREVAKTIVSSPAQPYNLNDISRNFGLSQSKLQGGFKFLFDNTVTEFIRTTRLKEAKELMKTTDMNISEIVYSIGFTSRSYFSKIFREEYSMSPNQYKKRLSYPLVA